MATGIRKRGSSFEAWVYSPADGKHVWATFPTYAATRSWRADAKRQTDHGKLRAPTEVTIRQAAEQWLVGAEAGEIRNRSQQPFKPSTLRGYRQALEDSVLPEVGNARLGSLTTADLQHLVDRWDREGRSAARIRNTIKPLQAIFRRAMTRGVVSVNLTRDLEMPAPRPKEVQIVAPATATKLLAAVPAEDRPLWATALYAGLRYGELRALRWESVDLATGTIRVVESWDAAEGAIDPKTRTSRRTVPMPGVLRDALVDHRLARGKPSGDVLVFGRSEQPFHAATLYRRADAAWENAGLTDVLRLHQARHTYASFMIAAGVNARALTTYMGHSSIKVSFDLYGHLMPGSEAEAAALLDAFLSRSDSGARGAVV